MIPLASPSAAFSSLGSMGSPISTSPVAEVMDSLFPASSEIDIFDSDFYLLAVPALLYYIQNNLLYIAVDNLDSLSFQLLYQLKIITTALFSVLMLGKRLTFLKWFSLFLLFIGVVLVQLNSPKDPTQPTDAQDGKTAVNYIGVVSVLISAITSGFSGVYFEKILKSANQSSNNVWHRNIQLGIFSCIFATLNLFVSDYSRIKSQGFFHGYSALTWSVIINQALGGLVVAVVVKFADNILKGFATSASIILGGIIGVFFLHLSLNLWFTLGGCLVLYAVYLYSKPDVDGSIKLKP